MSEMHWPGIRAKVWPIKLIAVPYWQWPITTSPANEFYGFWVVLSWGKWMLLLGNGQYKDRQP